MESQERLAEAVHSSLNLFLGNLVVEGLKFEKIYSYKERTKKLWTNCKLEPFPCSTFS